MATRMDKRMNFEGSMVSVKVLADLLLTLHLYILFGRRWVPIHATKVSLANKMKQAKIAV